MITESACRTRSSARPAEGGHAVGVLVLCTANRCRSVMSEALLARKIAEFGMLVPVRSAGLMGGGEPAPPEVISTMAGYGLDVSHHRSHLVTATDLRGAGLVLAMAREHVRHAVVTEPSVWPHVFTLKELARRGDQVGPRRPAEPLAGWLARVHHGRVRAALLGDSADDDVADPFGGPPDAYLASAALLDNLVSRVAELGWRLPANGLSPQR